MTQFATTYDAAVEYVRRGWKIIPLHFVRPNTSPPRCSCDRATCKAQGKHPQGQQWQKTGVMPEHWNFPGILSNIGILTGTPSGFWVLDYDPADAALGDLGARLHEEGYAPHVRTGGGGYHYRFTLPGGFEVRNRQSAGGGAGRTHSLPMGWDVRGEGGQVVAPPSESAKGVYVELAAGVHVPPAWLLDMIRPVEREAPPDRMVPPASGAADPLLLSAGAAATGAGEGSSHRAVQVQAYATAALRYEVDAYSNLTDGRRGEAAFSFGCNLVEIANLAGWSTEAVFEHYAAALRWAAGNGAPGGYAEHEIGAQWARAVAQVGDRARVMPPAPDVLPPFPPAPQVGAVGAPGAELQIVEPGQQRGAGGAGATGPTPGTGPTPAPETTFSPPVAPPFGMSPNVWAKVCALDEIEEAKRYRAARDAPTRPLTADLVTADELDEIPDPVPLIDGWLFVDSTARINGKPGQGKSFVAIDVAAHVASGRPWHGVAVKQGPVLYMAAEGLSGVKLRVRAWESAHSVKLGPAFMLLRRAVQVAGPEWPALVELARERRPALIVLDTQARITVGLRENDNSDMGQLVLAAETLREATGACVLLIHHKGKSEGAEGGRGGNAVEGAMVSEFDVWKKDTTVTVKTTRQKDIESGAKVEFTLRNELHSAVLEKQLEIVEPTTSEAWKLQTRALYEVLRQHSGAAGISKADAKAAVATMPIFAEGNSAKYVITLFGYAWNNLIMRGLLIRHMDSKHFGVHVMATVGPDGVLTPNVGEHQVADPAGWQTYAPDAVDAGADWTVNLGKTGGKRVSEAIAKLPASKR